MPHLQLAVVTVDGGESKNFRTFLERLGPMCDEFTITFHGEEGHHYVIDAKECGPSTVVVSIIRKANEDNTR